MKFGKQLRGIVECSYPEWQPNFMSYKDLKKRIASRDGAAVDSESSRVESDDNANRQLPGLHPARRSTRRPAHRLRPLLRPPPRLPPRSPRGRRRFAQR